MKINLSSFVSKKTPLVLFVCEKDLFLPNIPEGKKILEDAKGQGFTGKEFSTATLQPASGSPSSLVVLVGLGDKKNISSETIRRAGATAVKRVRSLAQKSFQVLNPNLLKNVSSEIYALTEGLVLSDYAFHKYKSNTGEKIRTEEATLIVSEKYLDSAKETVHLAKILSESACFVRNLVNEPPSHMTPGNLVSLAKEVWKEGKSSSVSIKIYEKESLAKMGMGSLLGVNRGSAEPPFLVHLHYKPQGARQSVALVGKGITFDSGGLSLKPAEAMETMKMDMAGAASILGVFRAIPQIKPKVEVHGILALTENMPGGKAYKPGDILKAMNGKTIEVLNTDAEGRLVLADALAYAGKLKPDVTIDIATLTGACIIALGSLVAGAMGNDDTLFQQIQKAGEKCGEKFWQLPLIPDYKEGLKSPVADIKNISSVRKEAGSIIGGLFLQEFVNGGHWIHLDIAGPAWSDKEFHYLSQGGTGFPTRTLLHYLLSI
ncbi:MAG: leucyl aminopeptidase [Elusimicrobia bacterium]|nr:leucyl aminopeptidase [Elusimicrobiota bacterium]